MSQALWCVALVLGVLYAGTAFGAEPKKSEGGSGSTQQQKEFKKEIKVEAQLKYLLFLPESYEKTEKRWPMILFLHGAGESGDDLEKVKIHGPPKIVETKKDFPFIVVSPQSANRGWDPHALKGLVDDVAANYRVDEERIYVTGLSMGGYGTWSLASQYPNRFAAIAPICGGGSLGQAQALTKTPIWAFHGAKDTVVPPSKSEEMVDFVKKLGGKEVKLTVYPEADHDSWTETYNNPALYEWFMSHKRGK